MTEQAKIIGLRTGQEIYHAEGDPEVISVLEKWLEKARSGEVVGVAIAALYRDDSVGRQRSGLRTNGLIGETFHLCHDMCGD